jgi:hypothetical protein
LPEVVGETGVRIESPEPDLIADGIRRALQFGPEARAAARERIVSSFPLAARRDGLLREIELLRAD